MTERARATPTRSSRRGIEQRPPSDPARGQIEDVNGAPAETAAALRQPVPPVEERVTFMVHRINARVAQVCNPVFARHAVDIYSSRILALLHEKKEIRVGDLVDIMVLPQSTISHQLQRMEKRGLIRRRRTLADNRSVAVTLTAQGRRTAQRCDQLSAEVYRAITASFTASELEELQLLLTKMFDSLDVVPDANL